MSVPQDDRQLQIKAIGSLCAYTHLITRFIPLVRDADAWQLLHGEELGYPSGTLETYCKRGWCRLEMLAALTPKRFSTGAWRLGSVNLRFRMHHDPEDPGTGLLMRAEHILNPLTGLYTVYPDTDAVALLVVALAERYAEYERSGSTAWDRTVEVRSRPRWLREAASLAPARRSSFTSAFGPAVRRPSGYGAQDLAEEKPADEPARAADEEKLVWAAADARELEPVEAPPQAHDDGLCGGSLMCDRAPVGGFSMEV